MSKKYYTQLDGVRALAILLVVASHTNAMKMYGQGGLAVAAFFALSGFLLVIPWQEDGEERFCSIKGIGQFYLKRVLRLLPAYYAVIFLVSWLTTSMDFLRQNIFFVNSSGHLWFLQQEILMYLIAPFIMILIHFLKNKCRLNNLCIGITLFAGAVLLQKYFTSDIFYLMGNGKPQSFRIGHFMIGMAFGYFYKHCKLSVFDNTIVKVMADIVCIILVLASIFSSAYFIEKMHPELTEFYVGWEHPLACAIGSSILYFLLLANDDGLVSRLLKNPIAVYIGKLSYGIYLIHYFLIPYMTFDSCKKIFFAVLVLSMGTALLIGEGIEKPINRLFQKSKNK